MAVLMRADLDRKQQAADLYRGGQSLRAVAEVFSVSDSTIRAWLWQLGVARRTYSEAVNLAFRSGRKRVPNRGTRWALDIPTCERCDDCDAELRQDKLYGCEELSAERREELGYVPTGRCSD
jgi:hypothetical protein